MFKMNTKKALLSLLPQAHLVMFVLVSISTLAYSNAIEYSTQVTTKPPSTKPPYLFDSREPPSSEEGSSSYYVDEDYSQEETCPSDKFWHIRGMRCVPFKCPRANWMRDWKTGECLYTTMEDGVDVRKFGNLRSAFKIRNVLRPGRVMTGRGRGTGYTSRWIGVSQKKRVELDDDMANPIRTVGLIGR